MTPMNGLGIGTSKFTYLQDFPNNYSIDLDGANDFVNLGNSDYIKIRDTVTSEERGITVSCWSKADWWDGTNSGYPDSSQALVSCKHVGGWEITQGVRLSAALNIVDPDNEEANTYLEIIGPYKSQDAGDQSHRASGWIHTCFTFDGRTLKFYVNGREETGRGTEYIDSESDDTPIRYGTGNFDTDVLIGADPNLLLGGVSGSATGGANFDGLIDQVAIWSKALDRHAVEQIYNSLNSDGAVLDLRIDYKRYDYSDNLVGYWTFEEGTGTTTEDLSDNSNTGTLKNGPAFKETTPL